MLDVTANGHCSDNPLIIEYERQRAAAFPYRAVATERLFAALHEAGHAAVALRHTALGGIRIPWRNPLSASMHDSVGRDRTADVCFAGHVLNNLLMGQNDLAHHDGVAGMRALCEYHEIDPALTDGLEVRSHAAKTIREIAAYLSSPKIWPRVESLACEAMKHERLTVDAYSRAATVSGFVSVGAKRQKHINQTLARFHRSPGELVERIGDEVVEKWRVALAGAGVPGV